MYWMHLPNANYEFMSHRWVCFVGWFEHHSLIYTHLWSVFCWKSTINSSWHSGPETNCQVEEKEIGAFGPGSCTECWCGSCCGGHFGWRDHIFMFLPGDVQTHSKTPVRETHIQGFKYVHSDDKESWNPTRHILHYCRMDYTNIQGCVPASIRRFSKMYAKHKWTWLRPGVDYRGPGPRVNHILIYWYLLVGVSRWGPLFTS